MSEKLYYCDTSSDPDNWQCKSLNSHEVPSSIKQTEKSPIVIISTLSVVGGICTGLIIYFLVCLAKKK